MGVLEDQLEILLKQFRAAGRAIQVRYADLHLTAIEVEGLVRASIYVSHHQGRVLVNVEATVLRWRRRGYVSERWVVDDRRPRRHWRWNDEADLEQTA